jgi:hypothetical protein
MNQKISINNPYRERKMISIASDMFFGRKQEMERIVEMLSEETPQCVSIVGERRIGKSSLANRVFHRVKQDENTRVVYIDCDEIGDECQTKDQFFRLLDKLFCEAVKEKPVGNLFDDYASYKAFVHAGGRAGLKTIIFMDEFEHLPVNPFADDTFFSNLRFLANNPDHRLAFVAVSRTLLKDLTHQAVKSSGFWNIFEPCFVGLLDHDSIGKLRRAGIEKTGIPFTTEEIQKIHYYAGDFPFFNQVSCGIAWDARRNNNAPAWRNLEARLRPHYREIWDRRRVEEQKLLRDLKGINAKEEFTLNDLAVRGLVIPVQGERNYSPFSGYFSVLIDKLFEVKKKNWSEKEIIQNVKEGLEILKTGREIIKGD